MRASSSSFSTTAGEHLHHGVHLHVDEDQQDLRDGLCLGPLGGGRVAARQAQHEQPLGIVLIERAVEAGVDGLQCAAVAVEVPHPVHQEVEAVDVAP